MKAVFFAFSLFAFALPVKTLADAIELGLFSEIVGLSYRANLSNSYSANIGFTHSQYENRDSNLLMAGFMARGARDQLRGEVGIQPFWLNGDHHDTYGAAIGGGAKYLITPELWTAGHAYFAPEIIVGGDFESFYHFDIQIGYNVLPHVSTYLAYQNYGANNGKTNIEMYNGLKLGLIFKLR
ncbi:MAG: YfaZ family outer membrane protein [Cellvibrionales bacterium]|nr:YfaZ family outer membrane protein [Cellvibrionales bacterium]